MYISIPIPIVALLYAVNFKQVSMVIIKREYLPAFVGVRYY